MTLNMLRNKRNRTRRQQQQQQQQQQKDRHRGGPPKVVGTEAVARENLEKNRRDFHYPKNGIFECPIEHSLIYAMLKEPSIYPRDILVQHIQDEDFAQYMYYHIDTTTSKTNINRQEQFGEIQVRSNGQSTSTTTTAASTTTTSNTNDTQQPFVSYAQLSALLGLAAEHYAPMDEQYFPDNATNSATTLNSQRSGGGIVKESQETKDSKDVTKILGKRIISTVIQYCRDHEPEELDRATEMRELLDPFEKYVVRRQVQAEMKGVVALYAGYGAMLVTGNPLPAMAGFAVWSTAVTSRENENQTLQQIQKDTKRRGDIETTSLLDEMS